MVLLRKVRNAAVLRRRAQGHHLPSDGMDGTEDPQGSFLRLQAVGEQADVRWHARQDLRFVPDVFVFLIDLDFNKELCD